jgi:hypothetical protein
MPVIRMYKNNYQLPKEALRNDQISLKAKGMLCMLMSLNDWNYNMPALKHVCCEGTKAIRSALKELEEFGYLRRERIHGNDGKIRYTYCISDVPLGE